jgi:phosphate-selective porin OprO/OprP
MSFSFPDLRKTRRVSSLILAAVLILAGPAAGNSSDSDGWKIQWKNGLKFSSEDGAHQLQIGGRTLADFAFISEDDALKAALQGGNGTGVEFRSARIFVSGTAYGRIAWKTQYDFVGHKIKDVWVSIKRVPMLGDVKIGHFKEPFSLEELTSLRFTTFMERSVRAAFDPSRNTGIQIGDTAFDKRMTWALGIFRETDSDGMGFSNSSAYQVTGRVTGAPIYRDGGREAAHLGLSYSHQYRDLGGGETLRWKARPESHLAQTVADTGNLNTDGADLLNLEAAIVYGPLSLQGEYTSAWADSGAGDRERSWGLYAQASYFLTGEHRNYNLKKGAFGRNKILKPLGEGWGAWQLAARFSRLRLKNGVGANVGNIRDITLGLNWYLYSNVRMTANYIHSEVSNSTLAGGPVKDGIAHIFQMRFQLDF